MILKEFQLGIKSVSSHKHIAQALWVSWMGLNVLYKETAQYDQKRADKKQSKCKINFILQREKEKGKFQNQMAKNCRCGAEDP